MTKSIKFILLSIIALSACKQADNNRVASGTYNIDLNSYVNSTPIDLNDYIDSMFVVSFETNDNSLIEFIHDCIITDNRIFILDEMFGDSPIKIYDREGHYINSIVKGQGPSEIQRYKCFDFDKEKNQLIVSDEKGIMLFDIDGNFIGEKNVDFSYSFMRSFGDEYIFQCTDIMTNLSKDSTLNKRFIITDKEINIKKTFTNAPTDRIIIMDAASSLCKHKDGILATTFNGDTIYEYDGQNFTNKYSVDFPQKAPSDISGEDMLKSVLKEGKYTLITYCVNSSHIYIDLNSFNNFQKKTSIGAFIFDQKSNKIFNINDQKYKLQNPYIRYEDFFVTSLSFEDNIDEKIDRSKLSAEDNAILDNLVEDSNPVLVFYRFKQL